MARYWSIIKIYSDFYSAWWWLQLQISLIILDWGVLCHDDVISFAVNLRTVW